MLNIVDAGMMNLPVFIRRYTDSKEFADMIHGYREITGGYNYAIENLTELPVDERYARVSDVIVTRKKAMYTSYRTQEVCPVTLNAYLVDFNNYVVVMSTDASHIYGKRVMKAGFKSTEFEPIGVLGKKKVHVYLATRYYQGILPKIGSDIARFKDDRKKKCTGSRGEVTYDIKPELMKAMLEYDKKRGANSLKSCIILTFGKIVCGLVSREAIIIKTRHEGGLLRWVPMIFNNDDDYSVQFTDIKDVYEKAEVYDSCSVDILNSELRYDCEEYSTLSYEFLTQNTYNDFLRQVEPNKTYFIDSYGHEKAPVAVRLEITDTSMQITYSYDTGYLEGVDIGKVHEMFLVLITRVVNT